MTKKMAELLVALKKTPEWDALEWELGDHDLMMVESLVVKALKMVGVE